MRKKRKEKETDNNKENRGEKQIMNNNNKENKEKVFPDSEQEGEVKGRMKETGRRRGR